MEGMINASMTMADEIIRSVNENRVRMLQIYQAVIAGEVTAIKPLVDEIILIWVQIYSNVQKVDPTFFNELSELKKRCIKISREDTFRKSTKEQYEVLDTITETVEKISKALDIIGIGIKVRAK